MNIFSLLFGLMLIGILLATVVGVIVALCMKRWKTAAGIVVAVGLGFGALDWAWKRMDPYVRGPVAAADVVGTYRLSEADFRQLARVGYKIGSGEITLKADGTYSATRIPACCVYGDDEKVYPSTGGYFALAGTWKIGTRETTAMEVELTLKEATLSDASSGGGSTPMQTPEAPDTLQVNLLKGSPYLLGFSLFNGDFYDITFERAPLAPEKTDASR